MKVSAFGQPSLRALIWAIRRLSSRAAKLNQIGLGCSPDSCIFRAVRRKDGGVGSDDMSGKSKTIQAVGGEVVTPPNAAAIPLSAY